MKGVFNFLIAVIGVLFIINCSNEPEVTTVEVSPAFETFKDSLYQNYKTDVLKKNRALLYTLFDSVAYKSLDLVLRDRVYPTNLERVPDLKKVSLNLMSSKLIDKEKNIDSVKKYIRRFISLRDASLKKGLRSKVTFSKTTNAILISNVFKNNILKEKDTVLEYQNLSNQIVRNIKSAHGKYETILIKSSWFEKEYTSLENSFRNYEKNKKETGADSDSKLKISLWLILGLLAISFFVNLVLGILLFRNRRKTQKVELQENNTLEREQQSELPSALTHPEVHNYISQGFTKLEGDLITKFHKDCIETQIEELKSFKSIVLEKSKSQQFKDLNQLKYSISPLVRKYQVQIVQKLAKIVDKHSAKEQLEEKLDTENFVIKYASSIVSGEEVRSKVIVLKKKFYNEIPKVISKSDLEIEIQNLRESLVMAIEKMITENSQFYFPFADAQGILYDDKKSKEKERDSAIKLTLYPKDKTRATFQLLYDYSDMMLAGIQSYDILLLPICDLKSENFNRNGTKIAQNGNDGEMTLEDGKWKLKTKLAIKITY